MEVAMKQNLFWEVFWQNDKINNKSTNERAFLSVEPHGIFNCGLKKCVH